MIFFGKRAKEKEDGERRGLLPLEELVPLMRNKGLNVVGEVAEVIFSADGRRRYVIVRTEKGYVTYLYEELFSYDEEEWQWLSRDMNALPGYWLPQSGGGIFSCIEEAKKELFAEPEYRIYFASQEEDKDE